MKTKEELELMLRGYGKEYSDLRYRIEDKISSSYFWGRDGEIVDVDTDLAVSNVIDLLDDIFLKDNDSRFFITEEDISNLKEIRNYFGEHDKTTLEHSAFHTIDRILKRESNEKI